eukprot:CAMPEP_0118891748 /NCGR_PEP_ID=MMETSP1166-20130328/1635_1 /TAXON_ID=1104430 /ORGANISM="Chrysoreinhardia sp, Strain CCMP3193" /LENGTH=886 /DNA_ID=CAMNT_0006830423 /DNA_START=90 /DNA_END=2747 /DNA_ORIENTATION=-
MSRNFRELKVEDALLYLDQVKAEFGDRPEIYNEFLEIMKSFKSQEIDTPGVIHRVSTLFKGYGKLIYGFNTFLPEGYKIDVPPELRDQVRGEVRQPRHWGTTGGYRGDTKQASSAGQQQQQQQGSQGGGGGGGPGGGGKKQQQGRDDGTLGVGGGGQSQQQQQQQQSSSQRGGGGAPQEEQLNRTPPEFDNAIAYVTAIKKRFAKEPETYKAFLEVLHTYQREQKGIQEVLTRVAELFRDHADLLREFTYFLPDAAIEPAQRLFLQRAADDADQRSRNRAQQAAEQYSQSNERGGAPPSQGGRKKQPAYRGGPAGGGGDQDYDRVAQPARARGGGQRRGQQYPAGSQSARKRSSSGAGAAATTSAKYGLRGEASATARIAGGGAAAAASSQTQKGRPAAAHKAKRGPPTESLASLRRQAAAARATARKELAEEARVRAVENMPRQLEIDVLRRVRVALLGTDGGPDKFPPADLDIRKRHLRGLALSRPAILQIRPRPNYFLVEKEPPATTGTSNSKWTPVVKLLGTDPKFWTDDSDSDDEPFDVAVANEVEKRRRVKREDAAKEAAAAAPEDDKADKMDVDDDDENEKKAPTVAADDGSAPRGGGVVDAAAAAAPAPVPAASSSLSSEKNNNNNNNNTAEKKPLPRKVPPPPKQVVAKAYPRRARKERLEREAVWRDVLKILDLCVQGVLSADDAETLLTSALEDAVDWGGGGAYPRGEALASDLALLLRKSARLAPTAECANQSVILARRAVAPGRPADPEALKDDLEKAQAFAKAHYAGKSFAPSSVGDAALLLGGPVDLATKTTATAAFSGAAAAGASGASVATTSATAALLAQQQQPAKKPPVGNQGTRAATRRGGRPSTRATSPPPTDVEEVDEDDASLWS